MSDDDKLTQAAKAIEGITKSIPVYQDMLQPAAKQIGTGLETVAKTIHIALAPISALVWGYEHIKEFVGSKIAEKLKNVPEERIQTPSPLVAGPLLASLRYAGHEETLRELYANLLATSIDSETAKSAHPGFVPILQSMSPDEAKIMRLFASEGAAPFIDVKANKKPRGFIIIVRNFSTIGQNAGCAHPELTPNYLDNLIRLGLLEIPPNRYIIAEGLYETIQNSSELDAVKQQVEATEGLTLDFDKKKIELTDLGKQFCAACVIDKNIQA
jgi:hypothetical protein